MFVIFYLQPLSTVSGPRGQAGTCVQPLVLAARDTRHGFESVITQNHNLADSAAKDFHMRPECASTRAAWVSGFFVVLFVFYPLYETCMCTCPLGGYSWNALSPCSCDREGDEAM